MCFAAVNDATDLDLRELGLVKGDSKKLQEDKNKVSLEDWKPYWKATNPKKNTMIPNLKVTMNLLRPQRLPKFPSQKNCLEHLHKKKSKLAGSTMIPLKSVSRLSVKRRVVEPES